MLKGAQNEAYLMTPNLEHFRTMQDFAGGLIKLVAIAPEEPGAMDFIKAVKNEVVVSLAHTTADYDTAAEAFQRVQVMLHIYIMLCLPSHIVAQELLGRHWMLTM